MEDIANYRAMQKAARESRKRPTPGSKDEVVKDEGPKKSAKKSTKSKKAKSAVKVVAKTKPAPTQASFDSMQKRILELEKMVSLSLSLSLFLS
jgi:hypothetical protein